MKKLAVLTLVLCSIAAPALAQQNPCPTDAPQAKPAVVELGKPFNLTFDAPYQKGVAFTLKVDGVAVQSFLNLTGTLRPGTSGCYTFTIQVPASQATIGDHQATVRAFLGTDPATPDGAESVAFAYRVIPTAPVNLRVTTTIQTGGAVEMEVFVPDQAQPVYRGRVDLAALLASARGTNAR